MISWLHLFQPFHACVKEGKVGKRVRFLPCLWLLYACDYCLAELNQRPRHHHIHVNKVTGRASLTTGTAVII